MSSLEFIKPIVKYLPEVKSPSTMPNLKQRLMWTGAALILFFVMYNVAAIGVHPSYAKQSFDFLQMVTASKIGSLITTGIGPIVLASIFLQLFVGAKIIDLDMSDPDDRTTFHGAQKILAIFLCFLEAAIFVFWGRLAVLGSLPGDPVPLFGSIVLVQLLVTIQIALGSLVLFYLDEVVSKYGIGSGISLFIAAGVSLSIVGGTVALLGGKGVVMEVLSSGGAEALGNAVLVLLPLLFTAIVFLVVVYAEGMKVEIPLAFERARGLGGRFPIKFLYVSNIPVILASALLLNMQFFAGSIPSLSPTNLAQAGPDMWAYVGWHTPLLDSQGQPMANGGRLEDGLLYYITPVYAGRGTMAHFTALANSRTPVFGIPEWVHALSYVFFLVILCVIFGVFWVETANMGPSSVAEQLNKSGLQIPGFRRDPRIVEKILERYIPVITILGSAFVGLLAGFADLTGALGTGTGILLTVSILARFYEELEKQKAFDLYPGLDGILGG